MVWERIEQKFREREDARIREQQEAAQRESARRQEQVRFQKENEAKAEQERNNRCEHAKRLMEESRIISHLEAIKNKVIGARKDLIIDLDDAYLSPRRVKTSEKVERSSYTGGSSSGECCHS